VSSNPATICGDITSFNIDPNTGRLSLITNETVKNPNWHQPLLFSGGQLTHQLYRGSEQLVYLHHREGQWKRRTIPFQAVFVYANSGGQLTLTQNTPIPTGATELSYIYASTKYVYLIDAQNGTTPGQILPYTIGTNGALQSLVGGAGATQAPPPIRTHDRRPSGQIPVPRQPGAQPDATSPASSVSAFFIDPTTGF
jgi:6-phosphogluconolactonase (cycloisomerase 2 family)